MRIFTFPFDQRAYWANLISSPWGYIAILINPLWKLKVTGRSQILWNKPYVIVANHQSYFDVMVLYTLLRPFKFLAKQSLARIPFIGWGMLLNKYIIVNRKDRKSRAKALQDCQEWLKKGISVVIFPEGTRSPDGKLKEFKLGAFRMAIEEKIPIVPVVIKGSRDILPKHSFVLSGKAKIEVKILEPIATKNYSTDQVKELTQMIHQKMNQELESSSEDPTPKYSA